MATKSLPRGSVLIIDDDRNLVETLTHALNDEGYFVFGSEDGAEAMTTMKMVQYNLVLMDWHMPRLSGAQLVHLMQDFGHSTPVVLMSGNCHLDEIAEREQVAGYLEKPFDLDQLVETVEFYATRSHPLRAYNTQAVL